MIFQQQKSEREECFLREWLSSMSCSDLNLLDTYASDTVTRAHAKHVNKMEKCEKVAMTVPEESIVSGTSRRVESCFSELKALKRSTSKIKARRIFVFAISKVFCLFLDAHNSYSSTT